MIEFAECTEGPSIDRDRDGRTEGTQGGVGLLQRGADMIKEEGSPKDGRKKGRHIDAPSPLTPLIHIPSLFFMFCCDGACVESCSSHCRRDCGRKD